MVYLVDVGNSNIVFAVAQDNEIIQTFRFKTMTDKTSDEYFLMFNSLFSHYKPDDVIISSVVPVVTSALVKLFDKFCNITAKVMGPGVKTGIKLKVDDPKTVGGDIICDCAGASKKYNEALIVDLGTATKYIYVKDNTFLGVSIAPGISVSMKALVFSAALLPNIELVCPNKIIGTNTISCMQSGVIYGAACQVDGMIDRIREEVGSPDLPVIVTGGLSSLIAPICKNKVEYNKSLTLDGLFEIYKKNI